MPITFTELKVLGDGNCMYHSLVTLVGSSWAHEELHRAGFKRRGGKEPRDKEWCSGVHLRPADAMRYGVCEKGVRV